MERVTETVLITGIGGFVGGHLTPYLLDRGLNVCGTLRPGRDSGLAADPAGRVRLYPVDVRQAAAVKRVVDEVRPDYIFHLAAVSSVFQSWRTPAAVMRTNAIGAINLLEAVRASGRRPRLQMAGSSEEYGMVAPGDLPVTEDAPLMPLSPYAVSKVAQDRLAYQYFRSFNLPVVVTRAFNTTGPGRPPTYVLSRFAREIVRVERGAKPVISVGNLDARRDFLDVRDLVRAFWDVVRLGDPGEAYNICSGEARSIREALEMLLSLTTARIEIRRNPALMRPADLPVMQGDAAKFRARTGWQPEIPFEQTLKDLLDYWRARTL